MGLSIPFIIVLMELVMATVHGSLMNRIGLRLGGKPFHEQHGHGHRARVPWAVKQMREDLLTDQRKPWQDIRNMPTPDGDDEVRPPPCVGICYYNKLVALEAKEDLTRHNDVYKQNIVVPDVVCPGGNCGLGEDGKAPVEENRKTTKVNDAVTGSAEGGVDEGEGPDIYIDDAVEEEEDKKDTRQSAN